MRLVGVGLAIAIFAGGASAHPPPPDPAVVHANRTGTANYREGYVGQGEHRIHYVTAGTGPPVIMVHGFPSFWYSWIGQMEAFAPCRRMIAIDAPGANLSGKPAAPEAFRVAALAQRLDEVITALAPDQKVTLVGHDWGGALAWSYAQWKPERLDRLAVFSAPSYDLFLDLLATDPEQRAASAYVRQLVALDRAAIAANNIPQRLFEIGYRKQIEAGRLTPEEGDLFRAALADPATMDAGIAWYRANIPDFAAITPRDAWPAAGARTRVPTLLVLGSEDRTFAAALADRARARVDALTVVTLSNVGHWTPWEDKPAANRAFGEFLGLPGGRCGPEHEQRP